MNKTTIELTPEDCEMFLIFQKNYPAIQFMIRSGVFEIKQGNAILSFTETGTLKSVKRELFTYLQ